MQAAAAFYNVEMITWHRKHHCSPDIIIPVVSTGRPKPLFMGLVHFVNAAGSVLVAPYGGVERRLSTAPYCVGIPRQGQRPIVLDFATSIVAEGKVLVASRGGKKLPKGALIDLEGTLSEDPAVLYGPHSAEEPRDHSQGKGAIRAFGEHKGSGLAFICELLGGALTGTGATGPNRRFANGMFAVYVGRVDDWRGGCRSRGVAVVRRLSPMPVPHFGPWLRFQSPLVKPDVRSYRIRLSPVPSDLRSRQVDPPAGNAEEAERLIEIRPDLAEPAPCSPARRINQRRSRRSVYVLTAHRCP